MEARRRRRVGCLLAAVGVTAAMTLPGQSVAAAGQQPTTKAATNTIVATPATGPSRLMAPPVCATASLSPANPSQVVGSKVSLTASSTGCPNPQYEFWVQYLDGSWHMLQGFGASTFTWKTAGFAPGSYGVHVWANQAGDSTATWEAYGSDTVTLTGCTSASISPPSVAQPAGTTVNLTASSSGCANPQFEFWVGYPDGSWVMKQVWGGPAFAWSTTGLAPGMYSVHVWANQTDASTATWEANGAASVALSICTSAALAPTNPSAAAGTTVSLTATSTGCANPRYEFWVQYPNGTWYLQLPFSVSTTFNWNTAGLAPGTYNVHVWANNQNDSMATWEAYGSDTVTLTGCATAALTPKNPKALAGTTVMLTASSTGCANPQYELWVQYLDGTWHVASGWGSGTLTWNTAGLAPGSYNVHVWANNQGDPTLTWEAYGSDTVTLSGCTSATAAFYFTTEERFKATSTGCPDPVYEFWLQYPDGTWYLEQGFSTSPFATWAGYLDAPPGLYHLHVWANEQNADQSTYEALGTATYTKPPGV